MDDLNVLRIEDFYGGISPRINKGVRGSFAYGQNLNIRENNSLKCQQALLKDSGTVVTDLVLVMLKMSNGSYLAFGDTGKIYRREPVGSIYGWELVYTDTDAYAPNRRITGAIEYKSSTDTYILYATMNKLKRIKLSDATDVWTGKVSDVGSSFLNQGTPYYHTMRLFNGGVIINDGNVLVYYGYDDSVNMTALTLPPDFNTRSLLDRNDRIIVGTDNLIQTEGFFLTWDGLSPSWITKKSAQGQGIKGMEFYEGGIMAQLGDNGILKYWNFAETSPLIRIPGVKNTQPGGVCLWNSLVLLGMNGGTKNGVYTLGRQDLNDPRALNLEYIPSHGKITGTTIGSILGNGDNLFVSWKDGTTYGIDLLSATVKADAIYESLVYNLDKSEQEKFIRHIKITLKDPLPAGCSVGLDYKATRITEEEEDAADANGWIPTKMSDDRELINVEGETKGVFDIEAIGESIQFRVRLYHYQNTTPEIDSVNIYFDYNNSI